jgi:hypothetical protein
MARAVASVVLPAPTDTRIRTGREGYDAGAAAVAHDAAKSKSRAIEALIGTLQCLPNSACNDVRLAEPAKTEIDMLEWPLKESIMSRHDTGSENCTTVEVA